MRLGPPYELQLPLLCQSAWSMRMRGHVVPAAVRHIWGWPPSASSSTSCMQVTKPGSRKKVWKGGGGRHSSPARARRPLDLHPPYPLPPPHLPYPTLPSTPAQWPRMNASSQDGRTRSSTRHPCSRLPWVNGGCAAEAPSPLP
jgi:hypothetical protein